jgi:glycine cleavage system H lipoate-binding protein/ABC-type phosphate transport system substrate-binding protein
MKTIGTIATLLLSVWLCVYPGPAVLRAGDPVRIQISCTPDVYPLTTAWVDQYGKANPGVSITVNKISPFVQVKPGDALCFFTGQYQPDESNAGNFRLVVGREVVVPVVSERNPYLKDLQTKGITPEGLRSILKENGKLAWGSLLGNGASQPARLILPEDGFTISRVATFLQCEQNAMASAEIVDKELFSAILENDPLAIGFCRLNTFLDPATMSMKGHLRIMPIDKNGNGKLDFMEDIYKDVASFHRGVWIGKYPKALTDYVFLETAARPENLADVAFIEWVLTTGQDQLAQFGFSALVSAERNTQTDKLIGTSMNIAQQKGPERLSQMILIFFASLIILALVAGYLIRRSRASGLVKPVSRQDGLSGMDEAGLKIPGGLFFDKTHTWAYMEKDGKVKVGIDDFLQHVTGMITRVEMKKEGERVRRGDLLCTLVQQGKQLNIYAPVSGEISECNPAVAGATGIINQSPYTGGWIYSIKPTNWLREIHFMQMADKYREWIKGEFTRLREFLTTSGVVAGALWSTEDPTEPLSPMVAWQDGGVLRDHVLEPMGPDVWEEFQRKFIDPSK